MDIVLEILFLILNNAKIRFLARKLKQRFYTTIETLETTKQVELLEKKKVVIIAYNQDDETFEVYIVSFTNRYVHSFCRVEIAFLIQNNSRTTVLSKYTNFANVFTPNLATKLPEYTRVNDHPINLVESHQPPYGQIYSPGLIELNISKIYIETNLENNFMRPFKFSTMTPIFYVHKLDRTLQLYINY